MSYTYISTSLLVYLATTAWYPLSVILYAPKLSGLGKIITIEEPPGWEKMHCIEPIRSLLVKTLPQRNRKLIIKTGERKPQQCCHQRQQQQLRLQRHLHEHTQTNRITSTSSHQCTISLYWNIPNSKSSSHCQQCASSPVIFTASCYCGFFIYYTCTQQSKHSLYNSSLTLSHAGS